MKSFKPRLSFKVISTKTILSVVGLCLLAGFVGASYFRSALKNSYSVRIFAADGSSSTIDLSVLEGITLLNLGSGQREQISLRSSCNTLLIFLSPGDCPNCLKERALWDELARSYDASHLRVIPILVHTSSPETKPFLEFLNVGMSVYFDETDQLKHQPSIPRETPFKALVCREKVLLAEGPNPKASEQAEFGKKVRATLRSCGE
jgi:hypothetical protein